MARPLIEVFSVKLFPKSLHCRLYGEIFIYNDDGDNDDDDSKPIYTLYDRDYDDPELISEDGQPLLLCRSDVPISIPNPVIFISIFDCNETSDKPFKLCCTRPLDISILRGYYDQQKSCVFEGEHGYVKVNYISMAFGVIAQVPVLIYLDSAGVAEKLKEPSSIEEESDKDFPVYGTIVARYGKTYGGNTTTCDSDCCFYLLKKTSDDEFTPLYFTNYKNLAELLLTRPFIAVPAYSSLVIDIDLKETYTNESLLSGNASARPGSKFSKYWVPPHGNKVISKYASLRNVVFLDPSVHFDFSLTVDNKLASMPLDRKQKLPGWSDRESLLEVYSVFIGRENSQDLSVFGEIKVLTSNSSRILCLFKRDEKNAHELVDGAELLSITGPSSPFEFMMADDHFHLEMELKDARNRSNISLGYIDFDTFIHKKHKEKYDKLLCSVIEGECGFCAVHYTVFSTAVGVEVKCAVACKTVVDNLANVYGKIVASYDMFDYSTFKDDKKYYGRVLFDIDEHNVAFRRILASKKAEESSTTCDPRQVELSTSYVAMPIGGYTLLLNVDLHLTSHSGRKGSEEHFEDTLEFMLGDGSPMTINGKDFDILVYVEMIPTNSWRYCDDDYNEI